MFSTLKTLLPNNKGVTAIEYGVLAALIIVVAVGAITTVGTNLLATFNTIAGKL